MIPSCGSSISSGVKGLIFFIYKSFVINVGISCSVNIDMIIFKTQILFPLFRDYLPFQKIFVLFNNSGIPSPVLGFV